MFGRLLYESFRRQRRRKLLAGVAIALGVTVATAMIAVATDIGDKINHELRSYGANLLITPQEDTLDVEIAGVNLKPPTDGAFLNEADLPKIKSTFWRHNIIGFSPMLPVSVQLATPSGNQQVELLGTYFSQPLKYGDDNFIAGVRITHPWWKVTGKWPLDTPSDVLNGKGPGFSMPIGEVLIGDRLAKRLGLKIGDGIQVGVRLAHVVGILSSGGPEDDQIVAPLRIAQTISGRWGAVRRVYVSALTKPEDAFARRDPHSMSPKMLDRWFCSPYAQSIAYQLQEAIPHSHVEQIRQVAQNEGAVLSRIKGLMLLVTLAALLASGLAVSAAMATAIFERRTEVGLMKALGAGHATVASLFFAEAALLALLGGGVGFLNGKYLAHAIGRSIFESRIAVQPVLFPVILAIATVVAFAGSAAAIRRAVRYDPVYVLRGDV